MKMQLFVLFAFLICLNLASAQTCNPNIANDVPDSRYIVHGDGTVTDKQTGLMWKQCVEGMSSSVIACDTGTQTIFGWQDALNHAVSVNTGTVGENNGYTDWRVPNHKELLSLVNYSCYSPAINITIFPNAPIAGFFWSSSRSSEIPDPLVSGGDLRVHGVDFGSGSNNIIQSNGSLEFLRLVRDAN